MHLSGYRERSLYGASYTVKQNITMADLTYRTEHVIQHELDIVRHQLQRNRVELISAEASFVDKNTVQLKFVDERGWTRAKASWLLGGFCFVLAIPSALSQGAVGWLGANGAFGDWDFLTLNNNIWGNYSLSIGAILLCLFVGWVWGVPKALSSLEEGGYKMPASGLWAVLIRFVCPIAILSVLLFIIFTGKYF